MAINNFLSRIGSFLFVKCESFAPSALNGKHVNVFVVRAGALAFELNYPWFSKQVEHPEQQRVG